MNQTETRTIKQRLRILWLFAATTYYDKPRCKTRGWQWSLRWWKQAWADTSALGS